MIFLSNCSYEMAPVCPKKIMAARLRIGTGVSAAAAADKEWSRVVVVTFAPKAWRGRDEKMDSEPSSGPTRKRMATRRRRKRPACGSVQQGTSM
jgi:hypothetical protein